MLIRKDLVCLLSLLAAGIAGCGSKEDRSDRSTPARAAVAWLDALERRSPQDVRRSYSQEANQEYVNALVKVFEAFAKLRDAAKEAYGSDGAKQLEGGFGPVETDYAAYRNAKEQIAGDTATLDAGDGRRMTLKKESGEWKVVTEGSADTAVAAQSLNAWAATLSEVAQKIGEGKYQEGDKEKNVAAVRRDLNSLRDKAMAGR